MAMSATVAPLLRPPVAVAAATAIPPGRCATTSYSIGVSRRTFIVVWWAVQLTHVGLIWYSAGVIEVHRYLIVHRWEGGVDYMGPSVFGFFPLDMTAHGIIAVGHTGALLHSTWWSLRHREWRFSDKPPTNSRSQPTTKRLLLQQTAGAPSEIRRLATAVHRVWLAVFGKTGLLGVEGAHYESMYFTLKVVEIGFQIFQAYKLSQLVPPVWINRLNAGVVVLNCWSTAIADRFLFRGKDRDDRRRMAKRVVLLLVDCAFDVLASVVVPLTIFLPYFFEFDLTRSDFPALNYYHDVWLLQAISENKQIFVTSWLDFVSKLSPLVTVLGGMLVLKSYIVVATQQGLEGPARAIVASTATATALAVTSSRARSSDVRRADSIIVRMARIVLSKHAWLLALCGLVVLVAHIHTTALAVLSRTPGCLLEVRPWFATMHSCVALELNCAQGEYDDGSNTTLLHSGFQTLLPTTLKGLVLASCSQLHMPPILQSLSSLQLLKIYNSTIVQWDVTAELRGDLHSDLQFLYVSDTNFSSGHSTTTTTNSDGGGGHLPTGLLGDGFPKSLMDIEFSGTNLVGLPANLHEKWQFVWFFFLERSVGITEFPETLVKMQITNLALGSNRITHIPEELLADQTFWYLMLDGNPLTALPTEIGDFSAMYQLGISYTNTSTLPEWITTPPFDHRTGKPMRPLMDQTPVFAGGSPLCEDTDRKAESTTALQPWFYLDCSTDRSAHMYPIEQEREWRAASQATFT